MNPELWQRVRAAFEAAVELPEARRGEWLEQHLGDQREIRSEVERLLAAEPGARDYLTPPGEQTLVDAVPTGLFAPRPGDRIGPYEIVGLLGQGGMGAVFEARQELPARTVALKVMRAGLGSERAHRRFRDEIAVLAKLQHPGIAQVFDAGVADGMPWFAMELLRDAQPITAWAQQRLLTLPQRLQLLQQVADAIEHAHQRGVIHRDLKPANILIDGSGRAKVIDFGIARASGNELERLTASRTSAGELLGTLLYMSPERLAEADGIADVRSDVYGLGVVLYELVTGRRPFELGGLSLPAACRRIAETEVVPPGRHAPHLPVELDWIALRALAKDPDRRYRSVADFAADLQRLLRHEPVTAAPPSTTYRLRKLLRRHRAAALASVAVTSTIVVSLVLVTLALLRARDAEAAERTRRDEAIAAQKRAEEARTFLLDVFAVATPDGSTSGPNVTMGDALRRASRRFEQRFGDDLLSRAELARTMGLAYNGIGDYEPAAQHLHTALDIRRQHYPDDKARIAGIELDLAEVEKHRGDLDAAEAAVTRADELLRDHPGERVAALAKIRRAGLLLDRGDKREGERLLRTAIAELQQRYGADDEDAMVGMDLLGGIRHRLGDLDGAEAEYRRALEGLERTIGPDHPTTLSCKHNLAMVMFSRNHSPDSVVMLEQVLAARKRVLGDEHEDTLTAMVNLGAQHYLLKERDQARTLWETALELGQQHLRPQSPFLGFVLLSLAQLERDDGHWPRAIELGQQILAARQRDLGKGNDRTLVAQAFLAEAYRQSGDLEHAQQEYAEALAQAEQRTPVDWPNVYRCQLGLGRIARAQRRFEDAERAFLVCRDRWQDAQANSAVKSALLRIEGDLVTLYTDWGKADEAAHYRAIVEDASYRERAGTGK